VDVVVISVAKKVLKNVVAAVLYLNKSVGMLLSVINIFEKVAVKSRAAVLYLNMSVGMLMAPTRVATELNVLKKFVTDVLYLNMSGVIDGSLTQPENRYLKVVTAVLNLKVSAGTEVKKTQSLKAFSKVVIFGEFSNI